MSYTLKKPKQSDVGSGYRGPLNDFRTPSYGLYIFVFVIILLVLLLIVKQTQESPAQQLVSASKPGMNNASVRSENIETKVLGNKSSSEQVKTVPIIAEDQIDKPGETINHLGNQVDNSSQNSSDAPIDKPVFFSELSKSTQNEIPKVKLNGIIFLDNEEDRYVLINMIKYYANDDVDDNLWVDSILPDSVIMRYKNKQFVITMHM